MNYLLWENSSLCSCCNANCDSFIQTISQEHKDAKALLDLYEDAKTSVLAKKLSDGPVACVGSEENEGSKILASEESSREAVEPDNSNLTGMCE